MKLKLTTRDLVNIAVFAVIYFVLFYAFGMLGFAGPIFSILGWALGILVDGIVIMLLLARVPKIGSFTITGVLVGLGMVAGHTIWILPGAIILGVIADLIATGAGKAHKLEPKRAIVAYGVFQLWMFIPLLPIVLDSANYYHQVSAMMGKEYADEMWRVFSIPFMAAWPVCIFVLALIGGWVGVKVGRKHFQRAGLTR